jgi:DNA-3-methyladenine glycosylase I
MLRKQESFRAAYSNYSIEEIAAYDEEDRERLMQNPGIVRNRLKINAAIVNAQKILELKAEFGSFKNWLDAHYPLTKAEWIKLFKKTFKFTGGEIVNEFLMSTGYLEGAHSPDCPIYEKVRASIQF